MSSSSSPVCDAFFPSIVKWMVEWLQIISQIGNVLERAVYIYRTCFVNWRLLGATNSEAFRKFL